MRHAGWLLTALLVSAPTLGEEAKFEGRAIEAEGPADARAVARVHGTRYSIPGSPAQIVGKAQQCLARRDSGAGVVSVDPAAGRLVAVSRIEYASDPAPRIVKGRLALESGEGSFRVVVSNLGVAQAAGGEEVFLPLAMRGADWELALSAVLDVEEALVNCMFS